MQNTKEKINNNNNKENEIISQKEYQENTMPERKCIVYLVLLVLILIYGAQFYAFDIIDRGTINTAQTKTLTFPDNSTETKGTDNNKAEIIEGDAIFKIFEGTKQWSELKELNIFNRDHMHVVSGKIAPGVQDTYTFTVECSGDYSMLYNMKFIDDNPHKINMKYKLKRNGNYVAGDENNWVTVEELSQKNMKIAPGTIDVFQLEWKWAEAENDTEIGETENAKYILNVESDAEAITER